MTAEFDSAARVTASEERLQLILHDKWICSQNAAENLPSNLLRAELVLDRHTAPLISQ